MKGLFKIRGDISKKAYLTGFIGTFAVLLVAWIIATSFGLVTPLFLPSPSSVISEFIGVISSGDLLTNTWISVYRILIGFIIAVVLAIPVGILVGCFKICESIFQPLAEFVRYMPVPAFLPLVMVWAGIGEGAKITIVFLGTYFQLMLMVADAIRDIPGDLLNSAYTLGGNRWQVIKKVIFPAMGPRVLDACRMMFGAAWTYLVVAELVAASSGLGFSILNAQRFLRTSYMFVGILTIGVLGLISDRLFVLAGKKLFSWAED